MSDINYSFDSHLTNRDRKMIPEGVKPIDWLTPGSDQHGKVLEMLRARLKYSEDRMSKFHSRWRRNELMLQAYVSLGDYDQILKDIEDSKEGPGIGTGSAVSINVPFAWATINTIVTYLLHMFGGRRPVFQVGSYRAEQVDRSKNMEMYLQYNADVVKFLRALYFFLMDGETYGVAIMRTLWRVDSKTKKVIIPPTAEVSEIMASMGRQAAGTEEEQTTIVFEGNSLANVDPFMFFPDPRVPMHEVNEKGEWVFWRAFMGQHALLRDQKAGLLKWVDKCDPTQGRRSTEGSGASSRGMRALGDPHPGQWEQSGTSASIKPNYQVDQGCVEIIPYEWGLGESRYPEKWMFTMLNEHQIVQAEPADLPAGKHPVVVAEPNSLGYAFGQLGTVDMLAPMQELMSWFMNSHIHNVRAALNNMFVVDPTKVVMSDLTNPKPGKLIRLKNTAFGLSDPKMAVTQLTVTDITRSHLSDFQMFGRLAADMTGATDNVRGLQDAGGRKTATEIRTSSEAGTSRLAAKGKIYSAQAFTGLAEMWALNIQANLSQEFEMNVLGQDAADPAKSLRITPENVQGDFVFPVHDGTLPIDKVGMLDVWKEIYMGLLADPELRQSYDILSMFDWIAQLGGAQNIKSFRLNVQPQTQAMDAMASGKGVPLQQVAAQMGGL